MTRLAIVGESKAIEIKRSEQIRNAFGSPQVYPVTAPATDDGRGAARFYDVVVIQWTDGIRVFEHHFWIRGDQGEKIEHHKSLKAELLGEAQDSPQGWVELALVRNRGVEPDPCDVLFRSGEQITGIVVESVSVFPAVAEDAGIQCIRRPIGQVCPVARQVNADNTNKSFSREEFLPTPTETPRGLFRAPLYSHGVH
jgi:hypothetical protein